MSASPGRIPSAACQARQRDIGARTLTERVLPRPSPNHVTLIGIADLPHEHLRHEGSEKSGSRDYGGADR